MFLVREEDPANEIEFFALLMRQVMCGSGSQEEGAFTYKFIPPIYVDNTEMTHGQVEVTETSSMAEAAEDIRDAFCATFDNSQNQPDICVNDFDSNDFIIGFENGQNLMEEASVRMRSAK